MQDTTFSLSKANSTNVNIIRGLSIQIIAISHGLEKIGLIGPGNIIGVTSFDFLILMSGMLIAYSIFKNMNNKNYDFKEYLVSRFSRIYISVLTVYTILIFIEWINNYNFLNHISTFFMNILLLNGSIIYFWPYGHSHHLWAIPFFWWQYLFFGWLLLGTRTTKKKYLYYIILAFLSFMMYLILFGWRDEAKIVYLVIWYLGANLTFLMARLYKKIKDKSTINGVLNEEKRIQLEKKVKYISLIMSILFFSLAIIRSITFKSFLDHYELYYNVLMACSISFLLLFTQYSKFNYPQKFRKVINFLASYSFTLFLIHISLYYLFFNISTDLGFFIMVYIIINIISIIIAYFTEMRYHKFRSYLMKKFKLDSKPKEVIKSIKTTP